MTNEEITQAAWKAWEEDMKTNPTQVNPYSFVYGYTVAAKRQREETDDLKLELQVSHEAYEITDIEIKQIKQDLHESRSGHAILARRLIETIAENERYRKALDNLTHISEIMWLERNLPGQAHPVIEEAKQALQQPNEGGDQ